ncbi:uncharacterized protein BDV17DRAFT_135992 [Aspergillus undulatus]|uniref:uncharacterized protein n=1 Tax=Aspergillus undulatus TaxID=1810928 RepID=UPI003CCD0463
MTSRRRLQNGAAQRRFHENARSLKEQQPKQARKVNESPSLHAIPHDPPYPQSAATPPDSNPTACWGSDMDFPSLFTNGIDKYNILPSTTDLRLLQEPVQSPNRAYHGWQTPSLGANHTARNRQRRGSTQTSQIQDPSLRNVASGTIDFGGLDKQTIGALRPRDSESTKCTRGEGGAS